MNLKILVLILLFFPLFNAKCQWIIMSSEADSIVRVGLDAAYNTDYNLAKQSANLVIQKYPQNPVGYFLNAIIEWQKILLEKYDAQYEQPFLNSIQQTIDVSQSILDTNPSFLPALFFKGAALGYKGRFYTEREDWINAIQYGKQGYDILNECKKIASGGNDDINLGSGLINYFAEAFPEKYPFLKPLMNFIVHGDKMLGKYQLEAAARNGKYANIEAKVALMQIYYTFERNDAEAYKIAEELHHRYPNNPYFHKYYARLLVRLGMMDKMEQEWRTIILNSISRKYGYDNIIAKEATYYIGMALQIRGKLDDAIKYLIKCEEICNYLDKKEPSEFRIRTNLRLAQINEAKNKKELALKYYKIVLSWPDKNGTHNEAKSAIKRLLSK